jgi:hypothetical protein
VITFLNHIFAHSWPNIVRSLIADDTVWPSVVRRLITDDAIWPSVVRSVVADDAIGPSVVRSLVADNIGGTMDAGGGHNYLLQFFLTLLL